MTRTLQCTWDRWRLELCHDPSYADVTRIEIVWDGTFLQEFAYMHGCFEGDFPGIEFELVVHDKAGRLPTPRPFIDCPKCGKSDTVRWRRGVVFEHMRRCWACEVSWDEDNWQSIRSSILAISMSAINRPCCNRFADNMGCDCRKCNCGR